MSERIVQTQMQDMMLRPAEQKIELLLEDEAPHERRVSASIPSPRA